MDRAARRSNIYIYISGCTPQRYSAWAVGACTPLVSAVDYIYLRIGLHAATVIIMRYLLSGSVD